MGDIFPTSSYTGTNLKVGYGGHIFCCCPVLHFFGATSTISRLGECFRIGQYSLVSFLFAVLFSRRPRAQLFVKVGQVPPVPYGVGASAHQLHTTQCYFSNAL